MKWVVFMVVVVGFSGAQRLEVGPATTETTTPSDSDVSKALGSTSTPVSPQENGTEDLAQRIENALKGLIKNGVNALMREMLGRGNTPQVSSKCMKSLMKFIADLRNVKMWALKMVDASSKVPPGVFEGTVTDYGSFDECLEIVVPLKNGREDFRGRYCAIEVSPHLPPLPNNFSLGRQMQAKPLDTIATELRLTANVLQILRLRFGVCVPSSCSIDDIRNIGMNMVNASVMQLHIPKCYVKESVKFEPIHIAVLCVFVALVILAVSGTVVQNLKGGAKNISSGLLKFLSAFSLSDNSRRLMTTSKSNGEIKALHGIRTLSMAWMILGHTYVWVGFPRTGRPSILKIWFNSIEFEVILNGWLSVEVFFFLSGFLTCYTTLLVMEKNKGRLNIPMYIAHRYLRLTPSLLLAMGAVFFLPIISFGPISYERIDLEVEACRNYWWTNLIYIANWTSLNKICLHPSWYLSADFQIYIVSSLIFLVLYRSAFFGMIAIILLTVVCNTLVGTLTYIYELPPSMLISSGNQKLIDETFRLIYLPTYGHVGPYCVGMVTGYLFLKKKDTLQLKKWQNVLGWSASIFLSLCSVYGLRRWNAGYFDGPLVSSFYAALHRTTFTLGVAWVTFACVSGNAGPVNWILSRDVWAPFSKLTYVAYLIHGPVIWTRYGSVRERLYLSHYNLVYEYIANLVIVAAFSFPFYLLMEAPFGNLERMMFTTLSRSVKENTEKNNLNHRETSYCSNTLNSNSTASAVELTSVKILVPGGITNGLKIK